MRKIERGVYFLANDHVFDLAITFLNSFRTYNQTRPLCLIPYNQDISRLLKVHAEYNFTVYSHDTILKKCDAISTKFHGKVLGQYRKLAMWEGVFEEFVYIDVDTVVLENIDFCFSLLTEYWFLTSHSNIKLLRKWVWKDSIFGETILSPEQIDYAANTGFIVSRLQAMTFETILGKMPHALALAKHMELFCAEQPLLNYLIVTSGRAYSSLLAIACTQSRKDMPLELWAGMSLGKVTNGRLSPPHNCPPVLLVHWAGEWQRGCHESSDLWNYYRWLRGPRVDIL